MDVAGYLAIARRWWLVITASTVLAAAGGFVVASQLPKVYEAEVRVLVGPLNTDLNTQRAAGQLAQTYAQLVTSQRITEAVVGRLGLDMRPSALQNAMTAIPNDVTRLVVIRVTNGDPELAAQIANVAADELARLGAANARPEGQVEVFDPAEAPSSPSAPQVSLLVILAAFAGLLAAVSCIILYEYFRDSLGSIDDLREVSESPILGTAPTRASRRREGPSAMLSSTTGDRYRMLTARIEAALGGKAVRTLLVAGVQSDGRAGLVATGVALGFADRGIRTALIDANIQHPEATQAVGLKPVPELDKLVAGRQLPVHRLNIVVGANRSLPPRYVELTVVPSSTGRDLGRIEDLHFVVDKLASTADVVVVTSPPVDRSPEAMLWARFVDAIVLVVPHPGARRQDLAASVEAIQLAGLKDKLVGTILSEQATSSRFPPRSRLPIALEPAHSPRVSNVAKDILAPRFSPPRSESRPGPRAIGSAGDQDG